MLIRLSVTCMNDINGTAVLYILGDSSYYRHLYTAYVYSDSINKTVNSHQYTYSAHQHILCTMNIYIESKIAKCNIFASLLRHDAADY